MALDDKVKDAWLRVEHAMEHESFSEALRLFTEAQDISLAAGYSRDYRFMKRAHQLLIQRGLEYVAESLDYDVYDTSEIILDLIKTAALYIEEQPPKTLSSLYKRTYLMGMCKEIDKVASASEHFDEAITAFAAAKAYAQKAEQFFPSHALVKDAVSRGVDKLLYAAEQAYDKGNHPRAQEIFERASVYAFQERVPLPEWSEILRKKIGAETIDTGLRIH